MLLKLRSTVIDLQNSWFLRVLGTNWICLPLSNSNFLESCHPLSSHLCVYSDTRSLALRNQSSWLVMSMCDMYEMYRACECEFVPMYICMSHCVFFSVYLIELTARESILVAIGIISSVVSYVSVSSRRFHWLSVALCRATFPLFLWEWQAYTEICPGVTASSQQHNWLTLLIGSTAFPIHELSFLFTKKWWIPQNSHINFILFFLSKYVIFYAVKCCFELICLYNGT